MSRILVVDDDEAILNAVSTCLRRWGYQILTASNGLEAVELFRSCPDLIDLVLTDMQMPVMTGNEAALQIWATRPDAKVICMTGYSETACPLGAAYLEKPFSFETLRHAIRAALESMVIAY